MTTRRHFLQAGAALATAAPALAANDRIRVGIIGPGARGMELVQYAMGVPGVEMAAAADVYTGRLEEIRRAVPGIKTALDYRELLADRSIDAVLIATPQHLHKEHFVASLEAGKHVYQEKTMAFTVDHAKAMRAAHEKTKDKVVQIGHQSCSFGMAREIPGFLADGKLGTITAIDAHMYRNSARDKPQWARPVTPTMTQENILWKSFLGDAPPHEFDANRYINWRFFWDYSGGNVYENMCHQISFWIKMLDLQVPQAVTMRGGVYLWKDGREVPDTMTVLMEQPEGMLVTWSSGFGNSHFGMTEHVLGTDGTILKDQRAARYLPEKINRPDGTELATTQPSTANAHMADFFECIRTGKQPNCPFEVGFRTSIACRMAVESYRQGRTVKWDPQREEIT